MLGAEMFFSVGAHRYVLHAVVISQLMQMQDTNILGLALAGIGGDGNGARVLCIPE